MHACHIFSRLFIVTVLGAALATLSACATAGPQGPASSRHLRIVNATFDDMTALAFAPSGSADYRSVALAQALAGGPSSITVDVPSGGCRRDVRVTFRGDRTLLYPDLDVCRNDGLRLVVGSARLGRTMMVRDDQQSPGSP